MPNSSLPPIFNLGAPAAELPHLKAKQPQSGKAAEREHSFKSSMQSVQEAKEKRTVQQKSAEQSPPEPRMSPSSPEKSSRAQAGKEAGKPPAEAAEETDEATVTEAGPVAPLAEPAQVPGHVLPTALTPTAETVLPSDASATEPPLTELVTTSAGVQAPVAEAAAASVSAPSSAVLGPVAGGFNSHPLARAIGLAGQSEPTAGSILPGGESIAPTVPAASASNNGLFNLQSQSIDAGGGLTLTSAVAAGPLEQGAVNLDALLNQMSTAGADVAAEGVQALSGARAPVTGLGAMGVAGKINMPVGVPFGNGDWNGAVAERAVMLVRQGIQSAELQLDPPELGPLQVRIQIQNDQATVNFVSANPQVREALDQTLARLKDMLQEQGFSQVETGVSDQSQRRFRQQDTADQGSSISATGDVEAETASTAQSSHMPIRSGIDYFA